MCTSIQRAISHLFSTKVANTIKNIVVNTVCYVNIFSGSYFNYYSWYDPLFWLSSNSKSKNKNKNRNKREI